MTFLTLGSNEVSVPSRALLLLFPLAGAGCVRSLPESPLGEDAVQLFAAFDEDPASLSALVAAVDGEMVGDLLQSSKRDREFDLPELAAEDFGGADVPDDLDTSEQMRAGLVGISAFSIQDNLRAQAEVNQTCINANAVKCHERLSADGSDATAFLAGTDEVYRTENTIRLETLPLDFWVQAPVDFRWVALDDGRAAAVSRTWIRESFTNDNGKNTWEQRFGLDVYIEDPDDPTRTRRMYATWLGPTVNGVSGQVLVGAIRSGLDDGFARPDDWLGSDGSCDVDLETCMADSPF